MEERGFIEFDHPLAHGAPFPDNEWIKDNVDGEARALPEGRNDIEISVRRDQAEQASKLVTVLRDQGQW